MQDWTKCYGGLAAAHEACPPLLAAAVVQGKRKLIRLAPGRRRSCQNVDVYTSGLRYGFQLRISPRGLLPKPLPWVGGPRDSGGFEIGVNLLLDGQSTTTDELRLPGFWNKRFPSPGQIYNQS